MATNNYMGVVPPGEVIVDPETGVDKSKALPRSSNGDQVYNMFRPADMMPEAAQPKTNVEQVQSEQKQDNKAAEPVTTQQTEAAKAQSQASAVDPNSPTDGLNLLAGLVTSPEQEEKMRRASVQSQRIMAVTNALRHIGNVIGTVRGANAQEFNDPVTEEQQRYLREKAVRDHNNMKFMTYQQAKAAQDAKARQWEADFGLRMANAASQDAYRQTQARIAGERAANQKAYQEGNLALREKLGTAQQKERERHNRENEKQGRQRIGIASQNAKNMQDYRQWKMKGGGGSGSGVAPLDTPKGQISPNAKNYSNQLLQMFDYAKSKGYVKENDVAKKLAELGFGKDQSDNVKRQMVMDLLRTNQDMGDYASSRLGWTYGNSGVTGMDLGLEDDEDEMDLGLE